MAGVKIVDLPALGRDLINTDLLEVSLNGSGSRKITGQEIMNASKLAIGSTPIVSGTVGRLLFQGTGDVLQQSGNLFWDATNNRLGIGTSAPASTFEVIAGSDANGIKLRGRSADNISNFFFASNDGVSQYGYFQHRSSVMRVVNNVGDTEFWNGPNIGSTVQRATLFGATGNLGLNTTTDAGFKLDVNGTARIQGTTTLNDVATCLQGLRVNGGYTAFNASTILGSASQSGNTFNFSTQYIGGATGTTNYFNFSGTLASGTGGSFNVFNVQQTFSNTNSSQTFRGFYYNPNITGLQAGTAHWAIHTTSGRVRFEGLPTSPTGLNAGDIYNDGGILKIV